jgi:hypothetical protein
MKTIIATIALLSSCFAGYSQVKRQTLFSKDVGVFTPASYIKIMDYDNGDTTRCIFLTFRNAKYSYLSDYKSVAFCIDDANRDSSKVFKFIADIKAAQQALLDKTDMEWTTEDYQIRVTPSIGNYIWLYDAKKLGYTWLNKKNANLLLQFFQVIDFEPDTTTN